jgi:hypothetical protein
MSRNRDSCGDSARASLRKRTFFTSDLRGQPFLRCGESGHFAFVTRPAGKHRVDAGDGGHQSRRAGHVEGGARRGGHEHPGQPSTSPDGTGI